VRRGRENKTGVHFKEACRSGSGVAPSCIIVSLFGHSAMLSRAEKKLRHTMKPRRLGTLRRFANAS
jgi:hypothetical protein